MGVRLSVFLVVLTAIVGSCAPEEKCSGEQYFDPMGYICRTCPKDATFKNGTCKCKAQYEFVMNRCTLKDGEVLETPDAGSGSSDASMAAAGSCKDYCDFAKSCIGDNTLAQGALPDLISGIHADNAAACTSSCKTDLGGDGAGDPMTACIEAGREAAACAGDTSQTGLAAGMMLVADCCRPRKDNALCKSICKPIKANPLTASMADFCL